MTKRTTLDPEGVPAQSTGVEHPRTWDALHTGLWLFAVGYLHYLTRGFVLALDPGQSGWCEYAISWQARLMQAGLVVVALAGSAAFAWLIKGVNLGVVAVVSALAGVAWLAVLTAGGAC
ncbi:MAG: hypothetical protein R2704_10560 [Microthrixaceae bacterium]